ncbi:immunoglobulin superfamily member 2 [Anolis carolinensis]|uniref:immunoglobulin superfamily member 2 n=1 Tax=Anolis carolinensis TaxID=28377 RepID=UPI002F2B678D
MRPIQWLAVGFFLLLDFCTGQRMVSIQKGRLYRAKGYHITIWCNVSGYQGQLQQDFQWSIYKPSAPELELKIIGTHDQFSPYAVYDQRVISREIYIERLQGDSILLHLTDLKDQDAGEYQCYTPNTDSKYWGTYSAKMNLSVIPDTLSATMKMRSLSRDQGDSLELTCEVSTATTIHTHLSVAWYIFKKEGDGTAQKIISLSRDFVLLPGPSYQQRFSSGDVRLDKTGSKEYKLSIANIQPSDQGEVYCEGVEWVQDPDETWKDIARKQTDRISLTVRSLDQPTYIPPLFTESHMQLFLSTNHEQTTEGSALVFHCNGTTTEKSLSVTWWRIEKNGDPPLFIASLDQDGTLKIGHSYFERSVNGELRLEKLGPSIFTLTIYKSSATQDTGLYRCEVAELSKGKSWSQEIATKVEPLGLNLNAELSSRKPNVKLYEDFELFCIVSGNSITSQVPVSITWQFKDSSGMTGYQQVVKVTAGGNVEWGSFAPHLSLQKKAKITKSSSVSQLLIHSATWQDAGMYRCEIEIWENSGPARSSAMAPHAVIPSNPIEIKVIPPESKLITYTSEKSLDVFSNEDITIDCKIISLTKKNSTLEITWYFLPLYPKNAAPLMILRTSYNHISEYGEAFNSPRQKSKFHSKKISNHLYQLLILSADNDVPGKYYCEVNEWIWVIDAGWHSLGKMGSGQTTVYFKLSENKPHIERTNHSITTTENEDGTLKCILKSPIQPTYRFLVSWFKKSEHFAAATLGEIMSNGSVWYSNVNTARRSQPHSPSVGNFCLKLQDVEMASAGLFFCQVEEWQAPNSTAPIQHESVPTNSSQICSPHSLYRFLLFYPPVLFLILVGVFLMLYFRRKHVPKEKVALEQNMISGEELTVWLAQSHFEPSGKNDK